MPSEANEKRARDIVYQSEGGIPCLDSGALIVSRVANALDDAGRRGVEAMHAQLESTIADSHVWQRRLGESLAEVARLRGALDVVTGWRESGGDPALEYAIAPALDLAFQRGRQSITRAVARDLAASVVKSMFTDAYNMALKFQQDLDAAKAVAVEWLAGNLEVVVRDALAPQGDAKPDAGGG